MAFRRLSLRLSLVVAGCLCACAQTSTAGAGGPSSSPGTPPGSSPSAAPSAAGGTMLNVTTMLTLSGKDSWAAGTPGCWDSVLSTYTTGQQKPVVSPGNFTAQISIYGSAPKSLLPSGVAISLLRILQSRLGSMGTLKVTSNYTSDYGGSSMQKYFQADLTFTPLNASTRAASLPLVSNLTRLLHDAAASDPTWSLLLAYMNYNPDGYLTATYSVSMLLPSCPATFTSTLKGMSSWSDTYSPSAPLACLWKNITNDVNSTAAAMSPAPYYGYPYYGGSSSSVYINTAMDIRPAIGIFPPTNCTGTLDVGVTAENVCKFAGNDTCCSDCSSSPSCKPLPPLCVAKPPTLADWSQPYSSASCYLKEGTNMGCVAYSGGASCTVMPVIGGLLRATQGAMKADAAGGYSSSSSSFNTWWDAQQDTSGPFGPVGMCVPNTMTYCTAHTDAASCQADGNCMLLTPPATACYSSPCNATDPCCGVPSSRCNSGALGPLASGTCSWEYRSTNASDVNAPSRGACYFKPNNCSDTQSAGGRACKSIEIVRGIATPDALVPATVCAAAGACNTTTSALCTECTTRMLDLKAKWAANLTAVSGCETAPPPSIYCPWGGCPQPPPRRTPADVLRDAQRNMLYILGQASDAAAMCNTVLDTLLPLFSNATAANASDMCSAAGMCSNMGYPYYYSSPYNAPSYAEVAAAGHASYPAGATPLQPEHVLPSLADQTGATWVFANGTQVSLQGSGDGPRATWTDAAGTAYQPIQFLDADRLGQAGAWVPDCGRPATASPTCRFVWQPPCSPFPSCLKAQATTAARAPAPAAEEASNIAALELNCQPDDSDCQRIMADQRMRETAAAFERAWQAQQAAMAQASTTKQAGRRLQQYGSPYDSTMGPFFSGPYGDCQQCAASVGGFLELVAANRSSVTKPSDLQEYCGMASVVNRDSKHDPYGYSSDTSSLDVCTRQFYSYSPSSCQTYNGCVKTQKCVPQQRNVTQDVICGLATKAGCAAAPGCAWLPSAVNGASTTARCEVAYLTAAYYGTPVAANASVFCQAVGQCDGRICTEGPQCAGCTACISSAAQLLPATAPTDAVALAESVYGSCMALYSQLKAPLFPKMVYASLAPGDSMYPGSSSSGGLPPPSYSNSTNTSTSSYIPAGASIVSVSVASVATASPAAPYQPSTPLDLTAGKCVPAAVVSCALKGAQGQCGGDCKNKFGCSSPAADVCTGQEVGINAATCKAAAACRGLLAGQQDPATVCTAIGGCVTGSCDTCVAALKHRMGTWSTFDNRCNQDAFRQPVMQCISTLQSLRRQVAPCSLLADSFDGFLAASKNATAMAGRNGITWYGGDYATPAEFQSFCDNFVDVNIDAFVAIGAFGDWNGDSIYYRSNLQYPCLGSVGLAYGLMEAGWLAKTSDGLGKVCAALQLRSYALDYTSQGVKGDDLTKEYMSHFCDPSSNACCPQATRVMFNADTCSAKGPSQGAGFWATGNYHAAGSALQCQYTGRCVVTQDPCYDAFNQTGICNSTCSWLAMPQGTRSQADDVFLVLKDPTTREPRVGPDGSIQRGVCYTADLWNKCGASKVSADQCTYSWNNTNLCRYESTCGPTNDLVSGGTSCTGWNDDGCCVNSTSLKYSTATATECSFNRTGNSERSCAVQAACVLASDPCASHAGAISCWSDPSCEFVFEDTPSGGYGDSGGHGIAGSCRLKYEADPCSDLGATECAANPSCAVADSCKENPCSEGDMCCPLRSTPSACDRNSACYLQTTCYPRMDTCGYNDNSTSCNNAEFCSWQVDDHSGWQGCTASRGHPCRQASDAVSCMSLTDSSGGRMCRLDAQCGQRCDLCGDCLSGAFEELVQPFQAALAANSANTTAASLIMKQLCQEISGGEMPSWFAANCASLASQLALPGGYVLATRPAAVCSALGMCVPGQCQVPDPAAPRTDGSAPAVLYGLDLCSASGIYNASAANVTTPVNVTLPAGKCLKQSDCASALFTCDFSTNVTASCTCDKNTGLDSRCIKYGTCISVCDTASVKADLARNALLAKPCSADSDCGKDATCAAADATCKVLTCTAADGVASKACTTVCKATTNKLVSAALGSDSRSVKVTLNAVAKAASAPCSSIFDSATSAKLGGQAQCTVSTNSLTIIMAGAISLNAGDDLQLLASQTVLQGASDGKPFTGNLGGTGVVGCAPNCPAPVASLQGPPMVNDPCPGASTTGTIKFSASQSADPSTRPLTDLKWAVSPANDATLNAYIAALNAQTTISARGVLSIPLANVSTIAPGTYQLTVTATNVFNNSASSSLSFTKAALANAPVVSIDDGAATFTPSGGVRLFGRVFTSSICSTANSIVYSWASDIPGLSLASQTMPGLYVKGPIPGVVPGNTYKFTLSARFNFPGAPSSSASVSLTAVGSDLVADVRGPSGDVPVSRGTVTFSGAGSFDPDDKANALQPMGYSWDCVAADGVSPCFADATYKPVQQGSDVTVDLTKFAPDAYYAMTLTVTKGSGTYGRSAVASLITRPRSVPVPTGQVYRLCGVDTKTQQLKPCPVRHNPSDPLTLAVVLDSDSTGASLTWSADAKSGVTLSGANTIGGLNRSTLIIKPAALPTAVSLTLSVNITKDGQTGTATVSVPLNLPPSCGGTCLALDSTAGVFPGATFTMTVADWSSPSGDQLSYEFGTMPTAASYTPQSLDQSTAYTFKGFSPGTYTLYVCSVDSLGARACQSKNVIVSQPAAFTPSDLKAALTSVNVNELATAKNPSDLVQAALQVAALLDFAAKSDLTTSSSGDTEPDDTASQQTNALIGVLAGVKSQDPEQMSSMLTAGEQLSSKGNLSSDAGRSLATLAQNTMDVNLNSGTALGDTTATAAANALCNGISAASGTTGGSATSRRRLLATSDMSPLQAYASLVDGAYSLSATQAAEAVLDGSVSVSGSAGVCVGPALQSAAALSSLSLTYSCSGIATPAVVTMPSNFSTGCAADATCGAYPLTVSSAYYSPDGSSVPIIQAVVAGWPAAVTGLPNLTIVSGVLNVTLNYTGPASASGALCAAATPCYMTMSLPLSSAYNASRTSACVLLSADTSGTSLVASTAGASLASVAGGKATCMAAKQGSYVVVSYDKPAGSSDPALGAGGSTGNVTYSQSAVTGTSKLGFTFRFNQDYAVLAANTTAMEAFKASLARAFIANVARLWTGVSVTNSDGTLQLARVEVTNVRAGSVVADVEFTAPAGTTATQLDALTSIVTASPAEILKGSTLAATVVSVNSYTVESESSGLTSGQLAGIVIGCVVGGVLLIAGAAVLISRRRRASAVVQREVMPQQPEAAGHDWQNNPAAPRSGAALAE